MKTLQLLACSCLLALGCLQPIGHFMNWPVLKKIGFATAASPLPLVFSVFRGYETFATEFVIEVVTTDGKVIREKATPQLYSKLRGPYNRRNVYGVVFSHGPMFDKPDEISLRQGVLRFGLCHGGPLVAEFGLPQNVDHATIYVTSSTAGVNKTWQMDVRCLS